MFLHHKSTEVRYLIPCTSVDPEAQIFVQDTNPGRLGKAEQHKAQANPATVGAQSALLDSLAVIGSQKPPSNL